MKLEFDSVSFRYGSQGAPAVLEHLSFTLEPGSYLCLAGPNGSGKSTLLKLAAGLVPAHLLRSGMTGTLKWNSIPIQKWIMPSERMKLARAVAFVPGSITTSFAITVDDFVLQARYPHSEFWTAPSKADREIATAALERLGLLHLGSKFLNELSSGESQLAALARALAQQPSVLILDEATASLDLGFQEKIFGLLAGLNREGMTILVVSHDLNLAAEFCPNVLWLCNGRAHAIGPMHETLTTEILHTLYGDNLHIEVGKNPFSGKPKVFWK